MIDIETIAGKLLTDALQLLEAEGFAPKSKPVGMPPALWLEGLAVHAGLLVEERGDTASPQLVAAHRALDSLADLHALLRSDAAADMLALIMAGIAIGEASSFVALAKLGAFEKIDEAVGVKMKQSMAGRARTASAAAERARILNMGRALLAQEARLPSGTKARGDFAEKYRKTLKREGFERSESTVDDYVKELLAEANRLGSQLPAALDRPGTPRHPRARSSKES